jgi:uncharacterized protein (TIGR03435 family)
MCFVRAAFIRTILLTAGLIAVAAPNILAKAAASKGGSVQQGSGASKDAPALSPEFDVVSIKPFKRGSGPHWLGLTPDGISIQGMPLKSLLQAAFGVEEDRILGAPSWVRTDEFDVVAKVVGPDVPAWKKQTFSQRGLMLRPILEDRFQLKFHYETKVLPFYVLTIAKGGSKMKEFVPPGDAATNGLRLMGRGHLKAQGISAEGLIRELSRQLSRTVADETGLTGKYDFTLLWEPDDVSPIAMGTNDNAAPPDSGGASLFTALQEQLGLKLESQKGPVSVIVIDHIEQPSPN